MLIILWSVRFMTRLRRVRVLNESGARELLRLRWFAHHRHRQVGQLLVTDNAVGRSPNHAILCYMRQAARRGSVAAIGLDRLGLHNPVVASGGPRRLAKAAGRI